MMACTLPREEIRSAPHHAGAYVRNVDNLTGDVDGVVAEMLAEGRLRTMTDMACRISELVINAADAERLAAFWSDVLVYVELGREDDGSTEIGPPGAGFGGPQPPLILSPSSDPRAGKVRLHIDLNATHRPP